MTKESFFNTVIVILIFSVLLLGTAYVISFTVFRYQIDLAICIEQDCRGFIYEDGVVCAKLCHIAGIMMLEDCND